MKTKILGITLLFSSVAFAAPTPLKTDVPLKNANFSQKLYQALEKAIPAITTSQHMRQTKILTVKGILSCQKAVSYNPSLREPVTTYGCYLLKEGWRSLGMEVYGSGYRTDLTKALYNALDVKVVKEEGISFKSIELEVADGDGGTERNLLSCTRVGKEAEEMGLRDSCEVINGL